MTELANNWSPMTMGHDALADLEALAYEAALEPTLWTQVVADASRAFKSPYMVLNVSDRRGDHSRSRAFASVFTR